MELISELPSNGSMLWNNSASVGIALAIYNPQAIYLLEQLQSILAQDFLDWHCLILDDASTIALTDEVTKLIFSDARFRLVRNEKNLGSFRTFEKAIASLGPSHEFLCFCDQDDLWAPQKLTRQIEILQDQKISLVHSDQVLIGVDGELIAASCWQLENRKNLSATTNALLFRNQVTGCTLMMRSLVLRTALPFSTNLSTAPLYHHDLWVAMHASIVGSIVGLDETLVRYRQHGNNLVGVAGLRPKRSWSQLWQNSRDAYAERWQLRKNFLNSLRMSAQHEIEAKKLAYIDSFFRLAVTTLLLSRLRPALVRTSVMLSIGKLAWNQKLSRAEEKSELHR